MEHILFSYLLPFRTEEIVGVVGSLFPDELEDLFFSFGD